MDVTSKHPWVIWVSLEPLGSGVKPIGEYGSFDEAYVALRNLYPVIKRNEIFFDRYYQGTTRVTDAYWVLVNPKGVYSAVGLRQTVQDARSFVDPAETPADRQSPTTW